MLSFFIYLIAVCKMILLAEVDGRERDINKHENPLLQFFDRIFENSQTIY